MSGSEKGTMGRSSAGTMTFWVIMLGSPEVDDVFLNTNLTYEHLPSNQKHWYSVRVPGSSSLYQMADITLSPRTRNEYFYTISHIA